MSARVEALFRNPAGILGEEGQGGDIAISSRIRLARNPAHRMFPLRADAEARRELCDEVAATTLSKPLPSTSVAARPME